MRGLLIFLLTGLALHFPLTLTAAVSTTGGSETEQSAGVPQIIPHEVSDAATGRNCLECHRTGYLGAPVTSHPERMNCTQCHVRGVITAAKPGKK